METVEAAELADAARGGDPQATARLFALHLPYWTAAARQIIQKDVRSHTAAGPREEPAELVQEALARLLELWRDGKGPTTNTRSYVATMMQHAYANKLRSPRTRERPLEDAEAESAFTVTDDLRWADLSGEIDAMRRALAGLSPDYRAVLVAVTAEGRKPAELTGRFGRSAPAISNMLSRAKQSLFRLMLIDYLSAGGPECAENAARLPLRVHEEPAAHGERERGMAHVRDCERCRRNWAHFAAVSSALGILPLVTVAHLAGGAAPAAAADAPGSAADTPASSATGAASAMSPTAGRFAVAVGSRTALGIGIAFVALAVLALMGHVLYGTWEGEEVTDEGQSLAASSHGAALDLALLTNHEGALQRIEVDFTVSDAENWSIDYIALTLSEGTEFVSASNGLDCAVAGAGLRCLPTERTRLGDAFVFEVRNPVPGGELSLELRGEADGDRISGSATGRWWPAG